MTDPFRELTNIFRNPCKKQPLHLKYNIQIYYKHIYRNNYVITAAIIPKIAQKKGKRHACLSIFVNPVIAFKVTIAVANPDGI